MEVINHTIEEVKNIKKKIEKMNKPKTVIPEPLRVDEKLINTKNLKLKSIDEIMKNDIDKFSKSIDEEIKRLLEEE